MEYKVLRYFTDLQDNGHIYKVGDVYPRKGYTPTEDRISELKSKKNRQKIELIQEVEVNVDDLKQEGTIAKEGSTKKQEKRGKSKKPISTFE